jgi:hypothetical protein
MSTYMKKFVAAYYPKDSTIWNKQLEQEQNT